jgi:ribosomal protein S18 acetylase RimI-like enzyme
MSVVRAATSADAAALAALRWEFRSGRAPALEDRAAFVDRCTAWMRCELDAGAWRAWVAEEHGAIAGQIWLRTLDKVPNPVGERDRHGYISNLYVRPDARGGVGTALLEAALEWAAAHRIDRVVLWPTPRSVALYERHGFVRAGDVMEKRCGGPA